jgi:energy-coupling factor transporter ATP-binding protein EcfA2
MRYPCPSGIHRDASADEHHRIIATCDREMILDLCPRTVLFDGGTLVADGPTIELLAKEPLMIEHGLEAPARLTPKRVSPQMNADCHR